MIYENELITPTHQAYTIILKMLEMNISSISQKVSQECKKRHLGDPPTSPDLRQVDRQDHRRYGWTIYNNVDQLQAIK